MATKPKITKRKPSKNEKAFAKRLLAQLGKGWTVEYVTWLGPEFIVDNGNKKN